ncbi:MAG: hypothetical protein V1837_07905 [Candidatus Woesearchaeota archaeon]
MQGLERNDKYVPFRAINVVLALYNGENKTLVDPFSFFLGRWRASRTAVRRENLEEWLRFEKEEKVFSPIFHDVYVESEGQKVKLSSLKPEQLEAQVIYWISRRYGNKNLWREGGDKVFHKVQVPYQGEIWLSGSVRAKGRAIGRDSSHGIRGKFHEVHIAGPFETSKERLSDVGCDCKEFKSIQEKFGYSHAGYVDPDIASLLYYARYSPQNVKNLEEVMSRRGVRIWLPFHPLEAQATSADYKVIRKGQQPRLSNLMVSAVLAYFSQQGQNKATINKKVKRLEVIYDPITKSLINSGKAGFEVVQREWIWDATNQLWSPFRHWFSDLRDSLSRQYEFKALAYEKEGTENEVVAMDYVDKGDPGHSMRILAFNGLPPLALERQTLPKYKPDIFANERRDHKPVESKNPYQELYEPKITYDHKRCCYTLSEVRLAQGGWTPQEMMPDYYQTLEHFHGKDWAGRLVVSLYKKRPYLLERLNQNLPLDTDRARQLINSIAKFGKK